MKKKIKDLTLEEMNKICAFHNEKGTSCLNNHCKCPLLFAGACLRGFVEKLQYIKKEVEVDD